MPEQTKYELLLLYFFTWFALTGRKELALRNAPVAE